MGENEHQSREWPIDIDQQNNLEEGLQNESDCCIYEVPQYLRQINEEAYTPSFISIGPLHYGRKELLGMQRQKKRYLKEFRERVKNAQKMEELKTYIKIQEQHIRAHYSVTSKLQSSEYIKMIRLDAIFIIELFVKKYRGHDRDFLLDNAQYISSIAIDLLLLENQIPYFVLDHLYSSVFLRSEGPNREEYPSFFKLSLKFFKEMPNGCNWSMVFNWSIPEQPQLQHFTDFLRRSMLPEVQPTVHSGGPIIDLPCVTKLNTSGLEFKGIEHKFLHQISLRKRKFGKWLPWFEVNELQIPCILIFDETEKILRNLMALEIFYYPTKTYICHYANLMDCLIDTSKDVDLLVDKGIIINWVGDIEAIVRMFNRINLQILIENSIYFEVAKEMKAHYEHPWNHLKATLKDVYFSNLWTGTATIAASFLLILTVIQTVYTIKQ